MLIGTLRPAVVLPAETLHRLSASELTLVLGHELAHIRRGDLLWSFVGYPVSEYTPALNSASSEYPGEIGRSKSWTQPA